MHTKRGLVVTSLLIGLALTADDSINDFQDDPWTGLWFPENPESLSEDQVNAKGVREESALKQNEDSLQMAESKFNEETDSWKGKWFPVAPGQSIPQTPVTQDIQDNHFTNMGNSDQICDDGMNNLQLDYDSRNITHHYRHLCTDEKKVFAPNYDIQPRLLDYTISPEYVALHKCMDEEIVYDDDIPTFGAHRKLWPVYGEYVFVPPQRWIHSLEHGAIVLLYHPCANLNQLDMVKSLVKKCLYRHIISAYDLLEPERPFALVAWGRSLEFSVVDQLAVVSFIRLYGLQGPEKIFSDGQYNQTLIEQSNIITSPDDNVLCQNL
ncbi:uncharacterized protein LOC119084797 [Bradysia coprophila]|uniref:uncharacterized protein LOC119084797 n=1 Tax=Bradysia coprophila TaxID=38358 RepID=UPI00187D8CD0|nr:uncharacterized protein LOC119084797 [Bradysia coprophila]